MMPLGEVPPNRPASPRVSSSPKLKKASSKRSNAPQSAKVAFIVMGSQGDNQPFVPLCQSIAAQGVEVELWAYGKKMAEWMASLGINAKLIEGSPDTEEMLRDPVMEEAMATGDMATMMATASKHIDPLQPQMWDSLLGHCERFRPTVIAYSNLLQSTAASLRDMFGCTVVFTQLYPRSPTAHEPPVFMALSGRSLPCCGANHLLHKAVLNKLHAPALAPTSELQRRRQERGLAPLTLDGVHQLFHTQPVLCGWSPAVFGGYDDMPGRVVGWWGLSDDAQLAAFAPSAPLTAFLAAGPPPLYIGWGSMLAKDASSPSSAAFMTTLAVEAAMAANVRVIILGGWAALSAEHLPAERHDLRAFCARDAQVHFEHAKVPHGWLLPQCAAAVIHGGAGTTAAVLRAGIPCVITPVLINDQPWWGQQVTRLGVGLGLGKVLRQTTAAEIAAAIGQIDDKMRAAAAKLATTLACEDGVGVAGAAIAAIARKAPPPSYAAGQVLV